MRTARRVAAGAALALAVAVGGWALGAPAAASASGCAANATAVPAGATSARIGDVDGDGRADTEFVTEDYRFGIRTASGFVHLVHPDLNTPGRLAGWAAKLSDGPAVAVLDSGREAVLYAFAGCRFVPVRNAQGEQYAFWLGGNGPEPIRGTGVACSASGRLEGVLARKHANGRYSIERTHVIVTGAKATNGATTVGRSGLAARNGVVRAAEASTCGSVRVVHNSGN